LYLVKIGATTIWERWDSWMPEKGFQDPRMNSFNMPNLGASIGEWLFSCVGGIETDGVGFQKILIKPYIGEGLTFARTSYDSIRGTIVVRWEKRSEGLIMDVTIPANTSATVSIPNLGTAPVTIQEGGKAVWSNGTFSKGIPGILGASVNAGPTGPSDFQ
jgi:alpha-L-rhamnosidase